MNWNHCSQMDRNRPSARNFAYLLYLLVSWVFSWQQSTWTYNSRVRRYALCSGSSQNSIFKETELRSSLTWVWPKFLKTWFSYLRNGILVPASQRWVCPGVLKMVSCLIRRVPHERWPHRLCGHCHHHLQCFTLLSAGILKASSKGFGQWVVLPTPHLFCPDTVFLRNLF